MSPKTMASFGQACAHAVVKESRGIRRSSAEAHAHGHVRILRELDRIRRAFFSKRREVFLIDVEGAGDFLFADRPLVVIEKIETPNLERAIVRAITRADTAVVSHNVQPVFAVN